MTTNFASYSASSFRAHSANVLVMGDSFVGRLESSLMYNYTRSPASQVMSINEYARDALKCYYEVNRVYFDSCPGAGLTTAKKYTLPEDLISMQRPKYAILEIGGNDLDSETDLQEILSTKIALADQLINNHDLISVAFCSVLPRDVARHISPALFRHRAEQFNIMSESQTKPLKHIFFHRHKGFWRDANLNPVDTSLWSTDGIHPNTQAGMDKYRASITKCIHRMIKTANNLDKQ